MERGLLTVTEAARVLSLSHRTIVDRLRSGTMTGVLVHPRLWLIPRAEVERWRALGRQRSGRRLQAQATPVMGSAEAALDAIHDRLAAAGWAGVDAVPMLDAVRQERERELGRGAV